MLNSHPQSAPQDKLAVPLPLAFIVWTTKVTPVVVLSPHPEVCDWMVAGAARFQRKSDQHRRPATARISDETDSPRTRQLGHFGGRRTGRLGLRSRYGCERERGRKCEPHE